MKKLFASFLAMFYLLNGLFLPVVSAQEAIPDTSRDPVSISIFKRDSCIHCQDAKDFFDAYTEEESQIRIEYIDIDEEEGKNLFEEFTDKKELAKTTPIIVVDNQIIQGFQTAESTGRQIKEIVDVAKNKVDKVTLQELLDSDDNSETIDTGSSCIDPNQPCSIDGNQPQYIKIPFYKEIDVSGYPLPIMSSVLGFIDGFNPCAMWVLVTFLFILLKVGDKRKMWLFAGVFIIAESIMYYLILTAWFGVFNFIELNNIITPIVGLLAVGSGIFFLYEWYTSDGTCKVVGAEKRVKIQDKIKELVNQPFTWVTLIGILGLAFSVNIIEFACSIGIPQTFTHILDLQGFNFWQSQPYLLLYILFYMIDDFIVFGIALWSFEKIGLTQKYSKATNLIGGLLMVALGIIMLFFPDVLKMI